MLQAKSQELIAKSPVFMRLVSTYQLLARFPVSAPISANLRQKILELVLQLAKSQELIAKSPVFMRVVSTYQPLARFLISAPISVNLRRKILGLVLQLVPQRPQAATCPLSPLTCHLF